jgi:hypothetical protein
MIERLRHSLCSPLPSDPRPDDGEQGLTAEELGVWVPCIPS